MPTKHKAIFLTRFAFVLAITVTAPRTAAQTLIDRYSFHDANSIVTDTVGGRNGVLHGTATESDGRLVLEGTQGGWVSLPNNFTVGLLDSTFEVWTTSYDIGNGPYAPVFQFATCAYPQDVAVNGAYFLLDAGRTDGFLSAEMGIRTTPVQEQGVDTSTALGATGLHQIVVTFSGFTSPSETGTETIYYDGSPIGHVAGALSPDSLGATTGNTLGGANFRSGQIFKGSIQEFRVYNGALTASQVASEWQAGPSALPREPSISGSSPSPFRHYWGHYSLTCTLDASKGVRDGDVQYLAVPGNLPPYQTATWRVRENDIPYRTIQQNDNTILLLPAGFTGSLTLDMDVQVHIYDVRKDLEALAKKDNLPACPTDVEMYLKPSPDIDCDAATFSEISTPLRSPNPVKTVRNLLQWMSANFTYKVVWPALPVSHQLPQRVAECAGWSDIFVGLCQSAGVPARAVWGWVGPRGEPPDQGKLGGHGWAEVYISGMGWVPVEPQLPDSLGNTGAFNIAPYVTVSRADPRFTGYSPTRGYQLAPSSNLIMMGGNDVQYTVLSHDP